MIAAMTQALIPTRKETLDDQRTRLRRAQLLATAALLTAAAAAIAAPFLPLPAFWQGLMGAAGEAGTVGGLADWFAVTALFRRPLGLPIPHTALIPKRKDDIGRSLARFIETHFLDPDLLVARVAEEDRAAQLAEWLQREEAADFLARRLAEVIGALVRTGTHLDAIDALLPFLKDLNADLHEVLTQEVSKRTGRFVPAFVDKRLAQAGTTVLDGLIEALGTPGSVERRALDEWLRARVAEIPDDIQDAASVVWTQLKEQMGDAAHEPTSETREALAALVQRAGRALEGSPQMRAWVNSAVERLVVDYIVPWRTQIGAYIEDVVRGWDAREVTRIVELQVGRDLQFIRINGTLIGALIGVALFLAGGLIGRHL